MIDEADAVDSANRKAFVQLRSSDYMELVHEIKASGDGYCKAMDTAYDKRSGTYDTYVVDSSNVIH